MTTAFIIISCYEVTWGYSFRPRMSVCVSEYNWEKFSQIVLELQLPNFAFGFMTQLPYCSAKVGITMQLYTELFLLIRVLSFSHQPSGWCHVRGYRI